MNRKFLIPVLSLALIVSIEAQALATEGPFEIVASLPISEPTWGARWNDLYLVAAETSIQVIRKTGDAPTDYEFVNQVHPAHDMDIKNCQIDGDLLYVSAKSEGVLAYKLEELAKPAPKLCMQFKPADGKTVGWVAVMKDRVYATYREGGLAILNKDLSLIAEGLPKVTLKAMAPTEAGIIYTAIEPTQTELAIVDARHPKNMRVIRRMENIDYRTVFRMPATVIENTLYVSELNGGVAVYDIAARFEPRLMRRYQEVKGSLGTKPGRLKNIKPGCVTHMTTDGKTIFAAYQGTVDSVAIKRAGFKKLARVMQIDKGAGYLSHPSGLTLHDNVLAIPTTVDGIRFYDVSDPAKPRLLLNIDLPSRFEGLAKRGRMIYSTNDIDGVWQFDWDAKGGPSMKQSKRIPLKHLSEDLVMYKDHLYIANGTGLGVIDVFDEANPHEVCYWDYAYPAGTGKKIVSQAWVEGVYLYKDLLYIAMGFGGIGVFDLKEPGEPELIGIFFTDEPRPGVHGRDIVINPERKIAVVAGLAFSVLDLSDPRNPRKLFSKILKSDGVALSNCGVFSPCGRYFVLGANKVFDIYDMKDPSNPVRIRRYRLGPEDGFGVGAEEVLFWKGHLLVTGHHKGITVYKIHSADLTDLEEIQHIPAYFYNSKFLVEGDRIFTNGQGIFELKFVGAK
ncbi:hypothetical protein ACFL1X_03630 [Candidatus Hydrogenedentota bacterium]